MKKDRPHISEHDMKAFCRYERQVQIPNNSCERYQMQLADLHMAIENILKDDPTIGSLWLHWFLPIDEFCQSYGLYCPQEKETQDAYRFLPTDDTQLLEEYWGELYQFFEEDADREKRAKEYLPFFETMLRNIETSLVDLTRPVEQRSFSLQQRANYIRHFLKADFVENAREHELQLCRKFTDALCLEDNRIALELKGYACYGGNRLYDCDWYASRDCMERLFAISGDGRYANTLGYIYYYGRCNDGEPEYEKAFQSFTCGAAEGYYESCYKLADMYANGYGCAKNPVTAKLIYEQVFEECLRAYLNDRDNTLADAALRMGKVFLEGIGTKVNAEYALYYLLQARYAQNERIKEGGFYGINRVSENIENAIAQAKKLLPPDYFQAYITDGSYSVMKDFAEGSTLTAVRIIKQADGTASIDMERIEPSGKAVRSTLLTKPELEYCEYVSALSFTAIGLKKSKKLKNKIFLIDRVFWNYGKNRLEFYLNNKKRGWIGYDELWFYGKAPVSSQIFTLATVVFSSYGKSYDYLCTLDDVSAGDQLVVPTPSGEARVTVLRVYMAAASELRLPLTQYKCVLRKADPV